MDDCEFCTIVAGQQSAHVLYEDDLTLAFLDQHPVREGHAIVVPKQHAEEILASPEHEATPVLETVDAVSAALREVLDPDGFSVFYTSGPLVGNVPHAHIHVVPRDADDGISLALERTPLDDDAAARLAASVREVA